MKKLAILLTAFALSFIMSGCLACSVLGDIVDGSGDIAGEFEDFTEGFEDEFEDFSDGFEDFGDEFDWSTPDPDGYLPDDHAVIPDEDYHSGYAAPFEADGWDTSLTGSAGLLKGMVAVVSVYVNDPDNPDWSDDDIARTQGYLRIAMRYLESNAKERGVSLDIVHDALMNDELLYIADDDLVFSDDDEDLAADEAINEYIASNVDVSGILESTHAVNIAFVAFVNEAGTSYATPFYEDDGDEWFFEHCVIFAYDSSDTDFYETPACCAHELLHLFGAVDLYEANDYDGVTDSLVRYVEREYPMEIMYTTYDEDEYWDYTRVPGIISPITEYFLGWADTWDGLSEFPDIERDHPGVFK